MAIKARITYPEKNLVPFPHPPEISFLQLLTTDDIQC